MSLYEEPLYAAASEPPPSRSPSSWRPSSPTWKNRRECILDAATELFAERGYHGTSMADLAEKVGLRKPSLFHHFATKDALYNAVFERLIEQLGGIIMSEAQTEGTFVVRLDRMTEAIVTALGVQASAASLCIREMMDWSPFARGRFRDTLLPVLQAAEKFVQDGQAAGEFVSNVDARHVVLSVMAMYLQPFTIGNALEVFTGSQPFDAGFLEARRTELRIQLHRLLLPSRL
jgi:TetR/AcrR family transcriptional regulator